MRKHTRLISLLLFIFIFFSLFLPVNAANDKREVTKEINAYMSAVKTYKKDKIQNHLINKKFYYWNESKKLQKHIRKLNKKYLTYQIKSVNINGNNATATVKISFYSAYDDSKEAMKETIDIYGSKITGKKMLNSYAEHLKSIYKSNLMYMDSQEEFNDQFIFTNTTKIPLKKVNGKWKIEKVTPKMQYQMDCVTTNFINDFSKNPFIIYG